MPIRFNSIGPFMENVGRRKTDRFGESVKLTAIYDGSTDQFQNWNPQKGSQHPQYPLLFLTGIEQISQAGNVLSVQLTYEGTDKVGVLYTNLHTTTDLQAKSFSWSGVAWIPYADNSSTPFLGTYSIEVQYWTNEVTFTYTTYKYQGGALFQSAASNYTKVVSSYAQITTGASLTAGGYSGVPTIKYPIKSMLQLTRFSCDLQTSLDPTKPSQAGIWQCTETWSLDFNMGSLGFTIPNMVAP